MPRQFRKPSPASRRHLPQPDRRPAPSPPADSSPPTQRREGASGNLRQARSRRSPRQPTYGLWQGPTLGTDQGHQEGGRGPATAPAAPMVFSRPSPASPEHPQLPPGRGTQPPARCWLPTSATAPHTRHRNKTLISHPTAIPPDTHQLDTSVAPASPADKRSTRSPVHPGHLMGHLPAKPVLSGRREGDEHLPQLDTLALQLPGASAPGCYGLRLRGCRRQR
jgi:hypothetical protein